MNPQPRERSAWRVAARIAALSVVGTLGLFFVLLVPDLWRLLPLTIRRHPAESLAFALLAAYGSCRVILAKKPTDRGEFAWLARGAIRGIDLASDRALGGLLSAALGVWCAALLFAWAPHYLTWPWCRDEDSFATLAMWWDVGIRPYRDVLFYNFPGHVYLHWLLGKTVGWGHTAPFYAVDAAAVAGLGVALAVWSRSQFGAMVPGLVAYLSFLTFYLGLEYELVAERDWHANLLVALGLMALETWPGWRSLIGSALLIALAITIRPHVVLFLPAMLSAVDEHRRRSEIPLGVVRSMALWSLALGCFVLVAFAPVIGAGLLRDMIDSLRIAAYGGPYSRASFANASTLFRAQLDESRTAVALLGVLALIVLPAANSRRRARTWFLALLGAFVYRPLHPVSHDYLAHPLALFGSVALALPLGWIVTREWLRSPLRLAAALVALCAAMPQIPRHCSVVGSIRALSLLARGEQPAIPPLGCNRWFERVVGTRYYEWSDYQATLAYLRIQTTASTQVANVLRHLPFPAINGPTGRRSPFLADSGLCWMWLVDMDLDASFAAALEGATDSVVVWEPAESDVARRLELKRVIAVIRHRYQPEARFGRFEIWRRQAPSAAVP